MAIDIQTIQQAPTLGKNLLKAIGTVEGFIMISIAIFIDFGEAIAECIPVVGNIVSVMLDICALLFIGGWMYYRSGQITAPKKTVARITKITKMAKTTKWLKPFAMVFEMIPVVSSFAPLWVVAVILELSENPG